MQKKKIAVKWMGVLLKGFRRSCWFLLSFPRKHTKKEWTFIFVMVFFKTFQPQVFITHDDYVFSSKSFKYNCWNKKKLVLLISCQEVIVVYVALLSDLNELCLVVAVPVSVDTLSQQGVKLLQRLHLGALCFGHSPVQKSLKNKRE